MFTIILHEPQIPQNAGAAVRLCAATGCRLVLVKPLGFRVDDRYLKRAGLDYREHVVMDVVDRLDDAADLKSGRVFLVTTRGETRYTDIHYRPGDVFVFGSEQFGLPEPLLNRYHERTIRIPILNPTVRSLNLASSVGIVLYEAIRQISKEDRPHDQVEER